MDQFRGKPKKMYFPGDGATFPAVFIDRNGNRITQEMLLSREVSIPCDDTDPGWINNSFAIKGETVSFGCALTFDGTQVVGTIQMITGFTPQLVNPLNSSEHSRINFRIEKA